MGNNTGNKRKIIKVIKQSITHWQYMIRWAKKHNQDDFAYRQEMLDDIGENWAGYYCPLCKMFYKCNNCPLSYYDSFIPRDCINEWRLVDISKTWGEWLENAEQMLLILKNVLKKYSPPPPPRHPNR
jgi:hypothetical protein